MKLRNRKTLSGVIICLFLKRANRQRLKVNSFTAILFLCIVPKRLCQPITPWLGRREFKPDEGIRLSPQTIGNYVDKQTEAGLYSSGVLIQAIRC